MKRFALLIAFCLLPGHLSAQSKDHFDRIDRQLREINNLLDQRDQQRQAKSITVCRPKDAVFPVVLLIEAASGMEVVIVERDGTVHVKDMAPDDPDDPDGPDPPDPPGPPPVDLDLSDEARQWLQDVPQDARSVQANLATVLIEIGNQGERIGSIAAINALVGVGVAAAISDKGTAWKPFLESLNGALDRLVEQGVSPADYGKALASVGRGLE